MVDASKRLNYPIDNPSKGIDQGANMNTLQYLDAAKQRLAIDSDYALSKALGVSQPAVSNYRSGRSRIDDDVALKLAQILDLNPLEVIAAANAERAKTPEMRNMWIGLMERLQGFLALSLHAKSGMSIALAG